MQKPLIAILLSGLLVSACGFADSRLNPFNWFGRSMEVPVTAQEPGEINPLLPRTTERRGLFSRPPEIYPGVLIGEVTDLVVERTDDGGIIRVTGLAERQGPYEVRLVPKSDDGKPDENGLLAYEFRVIYPARQTAIGSERTRRVTAAVSLDQLELAKVRLIRVEAATNARETRRR